MLSTVITLLWVVVALLVTLILLMILLGIGIKASLRRIEIKLGQAPAQRQGPDPMGAMTDSDPEGPFEQFLAEDPQRLTMPKSEQFAAYREWRKQNGMNWSNS